MGEAVGVPEGVVVGTPVGAAVLGYPLNRAITYLPEQYWVT